MMVMKMNHFKNENFDRVINALKLNSLELAKTYTELSKNEDYEFLIKIDFLKKDEAHLNHLLCSLQKNTECFEEELEVLKKYEEPYVDEKVIADLIIDSQIKINRGILNCLTRYVEHIGSNLPKVVLYEEFELLRYRSTLFTLNDDIIKLHCNSKLFISINNENRTIYLALSKLYYRKAELLDSILASDKEKLDENPDVIKLFLIIRKIHILEKIANKARQNYELTQQEENSIDAILNDNFSFENREFVIDEVRKEINDLKDVFNQMIRSIQDYSLDIFDESSNRIKRIIKAIMDLLLLNININLYFTKMD